MVRITKVYTKTGDHGMTRLAGGQQIKKTHPRIEAYGCVDELNATLGVVIETLKDCPQVLLRLKAALLRIQNELFDLGAQLAVLAEDRRGNTPVISKRDVTRLEKEIDEMNEPLPPLTSFILPGGGLTATQLHVSRTVCRRAERQILRLSETDPLDGTEIPYINRLSDWLFVASRFAAHHQNIPETLWKPGER